MNFQEFKKKFPSKKAIILHFANIRHQNGIKCQHCGNGKVYHRKDSPKLFECRVCNNSFSIFKDTIFEKSRTDLKKWFYAIHLFLNGKKGISALQLQRETGTTYKTAWRMLQQIRKAMGNDKDDDDDGVATLFELDASGSPLDTDGDGIIDPLDSDDDGDGLLTTLEDINGNGDPRDDDTDNDGIPNYLESSLLDQDQDGVVDELDSANDDPYNDQDGDGYANLDEVLAGSNPLDSSSFPNGFDNPSLRASIDIVSFFSPNSDGFNDTWQVKEIDRYPNNQVWIFTRSGYEVFNTQNYRNDWSGTQNGNPLPEGSYYYRIDLDGNSTIDFEGWLYLTR